MKSGILKELMVLRELCIGFSKCVRKVWKKEKRRKKGGIHEQPVYKILTDCVCLVAIVESGISKVYICECNRIINAQ